MVIPSNGDLNENFPVFDSLINAINQARRNARDYVTEISLEKLDEQIYGDGDRDWRWVNPPLTLFSICDRILPSIPLYSLPYFVDLTDSPLPIDFKIFCVSPETVFLSILPIYIQSSARKRRNKN